MWKFGTYEISAWAQLISNWTNGKGRFKGKPLRWNPDAPLAESTVSTSTSPARADPPDTLVPPAAASSIAQTIRKSPRKGTAEVAADGPSQIVVPQGASALSNDEMDHIFKRYSPLVENGMANSELCTVIVNAVRTRVSPLVTIYMLIVIVCKLHSSNMGSLLLGLEEKDRSIRGLRSQPKLRSSFKRFDKATTINRIFFHAQHEWLSQKEEEGLF